MPDSVIKRAKDILASLEAGGEVKPARRIKEAAQTDQISMLDVGAAEAADIIRGTNSDTITPIEALNILYDLKRRLGN